jgi:hypothetical protein
MSNFETADQGREIVTKKISALGAQDIGDEKEGRRTFISAKNSNQTRKFRILVKTRRSGSWQASTDDAKVADEKKDENHFWVFVDIEGSKKDADFYIVPEWWIQNNIHQVHHAYLSRHGGTRKKNPNSKHHSIKWDRLEEWRNRWDLLKIQED